jgi:NADH-quinone oxidoreductase subunit M
MGVGSISSVVFFPFAVALVLLFTGKRLPERVWQLLALAAMALTFASSLPLWTNYDLVEGGYQFVERAPWIEDWGIHYFVGIDGISLVLVLLTTFLMPIALLASWNDVGRDVRSYVFFMLLLETGVLGALTSLNLFVFYAFWELMLIPMAFIIGIWGGPQRVVAAVKFFVFNMLGSVLMLVALLVVYRLNQEQGGGVLNFDWVASAAPAESGALGWIDTRVPIWGDEGVEWWRTQHCLFAALALAFAIKVPLVPFHTWLPDAQVEAPTGGSVVLAAVLLKMGAYGFIRFALPLFPNAAIDFTGLVSGLALAGIVYGSLIAMVQTDLKRLVAYASVAQLGFVMLGLFALNAQGLAGGVLQMVNHGLSTGALLVLVGFLYERRKTRVIDAFGGVARPMPVYAAMFAVVMLSSIGLPALNGFVGEFLILLGTFEASPWTAVGAAVGGVLLAGCMLWAYRRVMLGPVDNPENRALIDLGLRERVVMLALIVPIIGIGIYPDAALRRIEPSVVRTLRLVEARTIPELGPQQDENGSLAAAALGVD